MTQADLRKTHAEHMARVLMGETGYAGAFEYAVGMKAGVVLESDRRFWSEVAEQVRLLAHPLPFNPELVPWIVDGRKRATTRRRPKIAVGEVFYVAYDGGEHGYRVTEVRQAAARELIGEFWSAEGYADPLEFAFDLVRIYPDITPETVMATHVFEAMG